ncbi:MAG: mechanosensitive ion channel family protein [Rhizobiaceae bacterium]
MTRLVLALIVALFTALLWTGSSTAQVQNPALIPGATGGETETVATATPQDIEELLRLLGNPAVVEELRKSLEQTETDTGSSWSLRREISGVVSRMEERVSTLISGFTAINTIYPAAAEAWDSGLDQGDALRALTYVLIFLFIGGGLEWLYHQYARPLQLRITHGLPDSVGQRVTRAGLGMALHFVGLAIFAGGSAGAFLMFDWPTLTREMVITLLMTVIGFRLIGMFVTFILAPGAPDLRLVPLGNRRSRRATRYVVGATLIGAAGIVLWDGLRRLGINTGYEEELLPAITVIPVVAAVLFAITLITLVWRLRQPLADDPEEFHAATNSRQTPIIFTVLIGVVFLLWLLGATELMWSAIILGMLVPAIKTSKAVIGNLYDQAEAVAERKAADEAAEKDDEEDGGAAVSMAEDGPPVGDGPLIEVDTSRYGVQRLIVTRLARFILILLAMAAMAVAWGVGLLSLSESPSAAGRIFRVGVNVLVTLLVADLIWTWAKTTINRRLADYGPSVDGMAPGPEARMATLLPILRMFLMVTIAVIVVLTVLSSMGVNIGPLLAGAGVAGIAIGFGAQALVKDVVSGIFFLLDDAFRVGEYIEMENNLRGTVESMSLRSLRVRHHRGAVHTIPFGELKSVTNHMRDWVIMKLEFRVPFDTDLKLVKKIVKRIGAELQEHEGYGHHILQTLKSQGVRRMEEFNMVVGVKFMARPGAQWLIRRDAYQKLRDEFEKNGISFAQRDVKVKVESDRPLSEEELQAVTGAAQQAVEPPPGPPQPVPDEP